MSTSRQVQPGEGVPPFRFGMTRPELWACTDSQVRSFLRGAGTEREDDLMAHGICVAYAQGRAVSFTVFARMGRGTAPIEVLGEEVSRFGRPDVRALVALHGLAAEEGPDWLAVPSRGLWFWFRQDADEPEVVEFVRVEAPVDRS